MATTSDEDPPTNNRNRPKRTFSSGKPRGRPYGSKNKPKPPIIITRESPNTLLTHFLEIPPNHDIIKALTSFSTTRQRAICILNASGSVTNLNLRQPPPPHSHPKQNTSSNSNSVVTFTGRFEILTMSGAFMPPPAPPPASGMSVFVTSGVHGGVLGGKVVGELMSVGVVVVVVSSFANSPYERLPFLPNDEEVEEEDEKVTLTVPDTGERIEVLVDKERVSEQERQQLLMMNWIPNVTMTTGLLHGFGSNAGNEMQGEEFWGDRPHPF